MAYTSIDDPSAHFQTTLYTGDGNDDRQVTNGGNSDLKPDLVWVKDRTGGATWNSSWSDTVFPAGSCAQNNSIFFGYGGFSGLGAGNTNLTNTDENGYGAFKYSPPSGFYALCTKNLAEYG